MKRIVCILVVLFAGLLAPSAARSQATAPIGTVGSGATPQQPVGTSGTLVTPVAPAPSGTTFKSATELVALNVTVTDGRDRFVKGLTKDDFAVFEDGVPQELTFFAANQVPLDLAIMIDTSASMTDKIDLVRQAATKFVQTLRSGDRAEVVAFASDTQVLVPFTDDKPKLQAAIAAARPRGSTALYNSLYIAVQDLARLSRREGDLRRPAIVVLTDGDDTSSMVSFDDLLESAKRANVAVYAISIVSKTDAARFGGDGTHRFSTESDYALRSLTQETGGRAFFPNEMKDLDGVYGEIADELSAQYSLAYTPRSRTDGSFHRLFVRVLHRDDVRPRTRTGYYAPRTVQAAVDVR
ncbi:MAG: VWA domain-containing protein [Bacteroidales bacterium]